MPEYVVPVVAAICAAFLLFIIVVGGVSIWTYLPDRKNPNGPDRSDPA